MFSLEIKKIFIDDSKFSFPHWLPVTSSDVAAAAGISLIGSCDQECVLAFFLDSQNVVVGFSEVAKGAINGCLIDIKVALRLALVSPGITSIILCHSHPSGNVEPSGMDDSVTKRLYCACEIIGIQMLDHIIVGPTGYSYSYAESGKMRQVRLSACNILSKLSEANE